MTIQEKISVALIALSLALIIAFPQGKSGAIVAVLSFSIFGLLQVLAFKKEQAKSLSDEEQSIAIKKLQTKLEEVENKVGAILISRSLGR